MNPRLFLLFVMVAISFQHEAAAFAAGPPAPRDVPLPRHRPLLLRPGEQITFRYEVRDGKVVILKSIPTEHPMEEGTVTVSLIKSGGTSTILGPVTPTYYSVGIRGKPDGKIALRVKYTGVGLRHPVIRSVPSAGHTFSRPIISIEILDFRWVKR